MTTADEHELLRPRIEVRELPTGRHIARLEHLDGEAEFRQLARDIVSRTTIADKADTARRPPLHPTQGAAERRTFALLHERHQIEDQRTGTSVEQTTNALPQRSLGIRAQVHEQPFDDHNERRARLRPAQTCEIGGEDVGLNEAQIRPRQHGLPLVCARKQPPLVRHRRRKIDFGVGDIRVAAHPDASGRQTSGKFEHDRSATGEMVDHQMALHERLAQPRLAEDRGWNREDESRGAEDDVGRPAGQKVSPG